MGRTRKTNPAVAIGYLRVSTSDQALGVEAQAARLAAYATQHGLQLAALYFDRGVSGASPIEARAGLLEALAGVSELRAGVVLVAKRDRVARDVDVARAVGHAVRKRGAVLVSADGNGNGSSPEESFMRGILEHAAAYERELIAARTKAALAAKRARGEKTGGDAPYGYSAVGGRLEPNAVEQAVIAAARELRGTGMSQRAIGVELAGRGMLSRVGKALSQVQVGLMLARNP